MKKFAVALFMLITSASASAQYIVWDPTNYVQNAMTAAQTVQSVIQQVQSYATQIRQYEMEVRQLAAMPANAINTIKQIRNVNLSNVNGYINSLQSLYGNLNGISNQISTQFSAAQLSNMTWDQYMDKLKTDVQNGVSAAKTRAQNEANTLQSIQQDYEMAKQWQSMIPATAGTHESMQLMNTQMNRMVMQGAQMLQQLQAMIRFWMLSIMVVKMSLSAISAKDCVVIPTIAFFLAKVRSQLSNRSRSFLFFRRYQTSSR